MTTTVVDPMVSHEVASALRGSPDLVPYGERRLPAEPASVRALLIPLTGIEAFGMALVALASYRLGAYDIPALHLQQVPYFLVIAALAVGCMAMLAGIEGLRYWRDITREGKSKGLAIRFHRRYVVPDTDMDGDATSTWARVVRATRMISRPRPAREHGVDPVWVTTVLPHHQWEIAEKLSRLTMLRRRQRNILAAGADSVDESDADIARILAAQHRAQELATADIERHVRLLEDVASRAAALDAGRKRERAVRDLAALGGQHVELVTMIDHDAWYVTDLERASRDLEP